MGMFDIMEFLLMVAVGGYLFFRVRILLEFYGADKKKPWTYGAAFLIAVFLGAACRDVWTTGAMVVLHFVVLFLLTDIAALLVRRIRRLYDAAVRHRTAMKKMHGEVSAANEEKRCKRRNLCRKLYESGLIPLLAAALIFLYGYCNMNHIRQTRYQVDSDKQIGWYRVVLMTDIHYGTIQDTRLLKEKLEEINGLHPDIVVLGGDMVDEGTSRESMEELFLLLGGIESRYGVYYIYGNHDRQPYAQKRTFTNEELTRAIEAGGIRILLDEAVAIGEDLILAGREDAIIGRYLTQRAGTEEILQGADRARYIILVDHEPVDARENAAQGVDLMLSGHTHAGQIWPVGIFNELTGMNYGEYSQGGCRVIVSSGLAGWGYPIRTGGHCEYVVIDISGKGEANP